jgi:hypothetical protein
MNTALRVLKMNSWILALFQMLLLNFRKKLLLLLLLLMLLTVNSCIKVRLDMQADKSPVVVKGPFFPRVVNPRYRIRGTMCNAGIQSSKAR